MKRNKKKRNGCWDMPISTNSNGTETKNSERDKKSQNGTKSDETEQKQRNRHHYMATKTKSNEMEQKVVKRTLINANINKK